MGDLAEAAASELSAAESYPKIHPNLPKRLIPVFLDKTNLTPGYLDEGLRSEVQSAKHLIVICSRSAQAKSKYLDNEIQYFLDGGGTPDRIGSSPSSSIIPNTPWRSVFRDG